MHILHIRPVLLGSYQNWDEILIVGQVMSIAHQAPLSRGHNESFVGSWIRTQTPTEAVVGNQVLGWFPIMGIPIRYFTWRPFT